MADKAIGVALAIIGLASLSVVISKRSNTAKVLTSLLGGFGGLIRASTAPVTGGSGR